MNARGMPARIRKKNSKYDDEIVGDVKLPASGSKVPPSPGKKSNPTTPVKRPPPPQSPSKSSNSDAPAKTPVRSLKKRLGAASRHSRKEEEISEDDADSRASSPQPSTSKSSGKHSANKQLLSSVPTTESINMGPVDKKACQRIGLKLRNLLKLPKAHKFVMYEFFYSNIDKFLLNGKNDFQKCLEHQFPKLKCRMLSKSEWGEIRRSMGKPRRCSPKFFKEERFDLERKRQKVRLLQSKRFADASFMLDMPKEIPLPVFIGSKVTARLRYPQDGLFSGTVEALEPATNSYKIFFDRSGVGTYSVPDYEVASVETIDTIHVSNLTKDFSLKDNIACYMVSPLKKAGPLSSITKDPLLGGGRNGKAPESLLTLPENGIVGNFPVALLEAVVKAKKGLETKHMQLLKIRRFNNEAELNRSYGEQPSEDFQKKYASLITGMERVNQNLIDSYNTLQSLSQKYITQPEAVNYLTPSYLREKCRDLATQTISKNNQNMVNDDSMIKLISHLSTIMWVTSNLKNDQYPNALTVLDGVMEEAKLTMDPDNKMLFQKSVQTHIKQIQVGIMYDGDEDVETEEIIINSY